MPISMSWVEFNKLLDRLNMLLSDDQTVNDDEFKRVLAQCKTVYSRLPGIEQNWGIRLIDLDGYSNNGPEGRPDLLDFNKHTFWNILSWTVQHGSLRRAQMLIDDGCDVGRALMLLIRNGDSAGITNLLALKISDIEAILNKTHLTPEGTEEYPLEYVLRCQPIYSRLEVDFSTIYNQLNQKTYVDKELNDRLVKAAIAGGNCPAVTLLLKDNPLYRSDESLLRHLLSDKQQKNTGTAFYLAVKTLLDDRSLNDPFHKYKNDYYLFFHLIKAQNEGRNAGDLPEEERTRPREDATDSLLKLLVRRGINPTYKDEDGRSLYPPSRMDLSGYHWDYNQFVTACNSGDQKKIDALFAPEYPVPPYMNALVQFAQDAVNGTLVGVRRDVAFRQMINNKLGEVDPKKMIPNIPPLPTSETQLQEYTQLLEYKIKLSTSSKSSQEKADVIDKARTEEAALKAAVQQRHPFFHTRASILSEGGKNLVKNNPKFQTIATVTEWVEQYIRYLEGPFQLMKGSEKVIQVKAALAAAKQRHLADPTLTVFDFVTKKDECQPSLMEAIKKPRWANHGEARGWTDFCDVFTSIADKVRFVQKLPPLPPL